MQKSNIKGSALLVLAALIWGLAFAAQSTAAAAAPPFFINSSRSIIGGVFLLILMLVKNRGKEILPSDKEQKKTAIKGGIICGIVFSVSVNLQQFGFLFYPENAPVEARSGFLTALYVILVPIISIFFKKKTGLSLWVAVLIAMGGIYMLCLSGGIDGVYIGDLFMFSCAVAFSFHIISIDHFVDKVGGLRLSMLQLFVCGIISGILSLIFEFSGILWDKMVWADILSVTPNILYLGIMSSGIAYTLQVIGQRYAEPAVCSIAMSLESVFAALGGWVIMKNALTIPEIIGCILVFAAIIIAQIPEMVQKKN